MHVAAAMEADDDASAYLEAAGFDFEPPPDYEAPEPSTAALRELLDIVHERQKSAVAAPTGAAQSSTEFADDALLRVYADAPCTTLLVAFAALGGGDAGVSRHEFVGACKRAGAQHALFVKDARTLWYHFGLSGSGSFDDVVAAIAAEIARLRPTRIITIGASMGGYAAIRAGIALRAERVIAFAPQVFVDPATRSALGLSAMPFDGALRACRDACEREGRPMVSAADALMVEAGGAATTIEVHVGTRATGDLCEALLLREAALRHAASGRPIATVKVERWRKLGHLLTAELRDRGELDAMLTRIVQRERGEGEGEHLCQGGGAR